MSGSVQKESWPATFLGGTKLGSKLRKWEQKKASKKQALRAAVSERILDEDLAPAFTKLDLRNILIPSTVPVVVDLHIDGEGAQRLELPEIRSEIEKRAADRVAAFVKEFGAALKEADGKGGLLSESDQKLVERIIDQQLITLRAKAEFDIANSIAEYLATIKEYKSDVKKWQIKCGLSIALGTVVIAGSAVVTGLTWGAASPAAVIGILRSCVVIGETIFKLAADIDTQGKVVATQLKILKTVMDSKVDGQTPTEAADAKRSNTVKETMGGLASGILGTGMPPTVKNCKEQLEVYDKKLKSLVVSRDGLAVKKSEMKSRIDGLQKKPALGDDKKQKAFDELLLRLRDKLTAIDTCIVSGAGGIQKGKSNYDEWTSALDKMEVHGWTKFVAPAAGIVTDLALAAGGAAPDGLMVGLAAITSLAASVGDQTLERV